MNDPILIYLDRLQGGKEEQVNLFLTKEELNATLPILPIAGKVHVQGSYYLANHHLIVQLRITCSFLIPCKICNQNSLHQIEIENFLHTQDIDQIKGKIYPYTKKIKEAIAVELPSYVECMDVCPQRAELSPYLKQNESVTGFSSPKANQFLPFENL